MKPNFKRIYVQEAVHTRPTWERDANDIIAQFPGVEVISVESHARIPALRNADPGDWTRTKRDNLVLGVKAGLHHTPNGRSANYIAASHSNGCLSSC